MLGTCGLACPVCGRILLNPSCSGVTVYTGKFTDAPQTLHLKRTHQHVNVERNTQDEVLMQYSGFSGLVATIQNVGQ